ncbi:hypothetical protein B0H10DRAFT_2236481 [Mycena sp. CBHHK59/15]|nr:hypothetical protein B0H10DRAFT_2236481 [Mycena sp. CBHHK59/15]
MHASGFLGLGAPLAVLLFIHLLRELTRGLTSNASSDFSKRSRRIPTLVSMCLFVLGQSLGTNEVYVDEEFAEIYETVPAHHRSVAMLYHGCSWISSHIPVHSDSLITFIGAVNTFSVSPEAQALLMLTIFPNSSYIETADSFCEMLEEALTGYHGSRSLNPLPHVVDRAIVSAAGPMADFVFDLMVLLEVERREDDSFQHARRPQAKHLKPLLCRLAFYVDSHREPPRGMILPRLCAKDVDESRDPLDLFQYTHW